MHSYKHRPLLSCLSSLASMERKARRAHSKSSLLFMAASFAACR